MSSRTMLVRLSDVFKYGDDEAAMTTLKHALAHSANKSVTAQDVTRTSNILEGHWVRTVGHLRVVYQAGEWTALGLQKHVAAELLAAILSTEVAPEVDALAAPVVAVTNPALDDIIHSLDEGAESLVSKVRAESKRTFAPRTYKYESDLDENGLLFAIGTSFGTKPWQNPMLKGDVVVTSTSLFSDSAHISGVVGRGAVRIATEDNEQGWIAINLKDNLIRPTSYTLRHYSSWDTECLRSWVFEGSADGSAWAPLRTHIKDKSLNKAGACYTWKLSLPKEDHPLWYFSHFRVRMTDINSRSHNYVCLSGFELYGDTISRKTYNSRLAAFEPVDVKTADKTRVYRYRSDFDRFGVLYAMATREGKVPWTNPVDLDLVNVTATSTMHDSLPIKAILRHNILTRCGTANVQYSAVTVALKKHSLAPVAYTLKHYSSWNVEALRSWKLMASTGDSTWVTLMEHHNDAHLDCKGATHTWQLPKSVHTGLFFRQFKILLTGPNSNGHHHLCLSGFEMYGRLKPLTDETKSKKDVMDFSIPQVFTYNSDMDENGLLYYLGSQGRSQQWVNPMEQKLVEVTASSLSGDSQPASAIVGRSGVRCVTEGKVGSNFVIDFKNLLVLPTHYSLRHYCTWDVEALRSWKLLASKEGARWEVLREHQDDESLYYASQTHTWPITDTKQDGYRFFKVQQTGFNSNKHLFLALSGFEVYGTVRKNTAPIKSLASSSVMLNKVSSPAILPSQKPALNIWSSKDSSPVYKLSNQASAATNTGTTNKWEYVSGPIYKSGVHVICMSIKNSTTTSNKWGIIVGCSPVVRVKDHHLWIGKKGGWGIIAGTGGKCVRGRSLPYGKPFTTGDLISIKLDFNTRAVAFAVNGEWQGLAFENLSGPVTVGASTTGCGTCIELMEDPYFEVKGDKVQMKAVVQKNRLAVPKATIRESKRNALSTAWDPAVKSSFTQVQGAQNDIAVNPGSNNKWTAIRGVVAFDPKVDGKQSFTVKIRATGTTPNSWKFIAGLVPVKFTCKRSKHWIGAYGGYGYIAGTGKKCHDTSTAGGYGATWGDLNDTIKCEVDYSVGEVGFYRNNVYQGVAFTNVPKLPLYPALSLTAADCQVQMIHHT